jgi:hypothetical protein
MRAKLDRARPRAHSPHIPGRRRRSGAPRARFLRARTPEVRIFAALCRRRQEAPLASTAGKRLRPAACRRFRLVAGMTAVWAPAEGGAGADLSAASSPSPGLTGGLIRGSNTVPARLGPRVKPADDGKVGAKRTARVIARTITTFPDAKRSGA